LIIIQNPNYPAYDQHNPNSNSNYCQQNPGYGQQIPGYGRQQAPYIAPTYNQSNPIGYNENPSGGYYQQQQGYTNDPFVQPSVYNGQNQIGILNNKSANQPASLPNPYE